MIAPSTFAGAAIWHSRATTAESSPPLIPTAKPPAPDRESCSRSQTTTASGRTRIAEELYQGLVLDDAEERVDEVGVELPAALAIDLAYRVADRPRRLVRPLLCKRIEHVGDCDDAAGERDVGTADAGIAAAVPSFVMG